ncbi:MAG: CHAP domain-containing protein [Burkholderiales bacterium]|nr:CHAP domain-containing protein [Bacteroidia bacterium]
MLTSFTNHEILKPFCYFQTTDSIPEMNRRIIDYVNTKLKKKVGTGECWDFAAEALASVNAKWDMKYKFGKEINYKKEPVFPGDIIQFENVLLNYEIKGVKYKEKMSHHTAIIYEVKDKTNFMIAHQNNGYSGRKVGVSPLDLATLTKGKFTIYRPEK